MTSLAAKPRCILNPGGRIRRFAGSRSSRRRYGHVSSFDAAQVARPQTALKLAFAPRPSWMPRSPRTDA
jgi:hypothetical protein